MKVLISGAGGRMGAEVASLIEAEKNMEVVAGVDRNAGSAKFRIFSSFEEVGNLTVDMIIDFSLPELCVQVCRWASEKRIPLVSGTTGLSAAEKSEVEKAGEKTAVLWSPNMSLGIAWFESVMAQFAKLEGFDFQLEETHHRMKKDKPSGTAVFLQEALEKAVGPTEPPLSIRGGGVFGIHKVQAMAMEETISIEHVALNRTVFARGAIRAARWLSGRSAGLYRLKDVLGAY